MESVQIHDKTFVPYLKDAEIQEIVKATALKIYEDYKDETPVFIGVLNGSFMVLSDLMKHYRGMCEVNFVKMSSYEGMETTNKVNELIGLNQDLTGKTVVVVEDIVDTGNTIEVLKDILKSKNVKHFKI